MKRAKYRTAPETKNNFRRIWLSARSLNVNGSGSYPLCLASTPVQSDVSATITIADSVTYGEDIPLWRQQIAGARPATTTLTGTRRTHFARAFSSSYSGVKGNPWTQCLRGASSGQNVNVFQFAKYPTGTSDSEAETKAVSALLKSYLKARSSFRGGNFAAELLDTVRMFLRPSKLLSEKTWTFVGRVGKIKKIYQQDPERYGQLLGKSWLAYAFALKPLVSDAQDFYNAMADLCEKGRGAVTIKGSGRAIYRGEEILRAGVPSAGYVEHNIHTFYENSVRYKGAIRATAPSPAGFAEHFGLSTLDILPALWEAVPWSFLIDYFVNVNEILESMKWMEADVGWLQRTWYNNHTVVGGSIVPVPNVSPSDYLLTCSGGDYWVKSIKFGREPIMKVPAPQWKFKLPSAGQAFNVVALAAAILDTKPNRDKLSKFGDTLRKTAKGTDYTD